MADSDSNSFVTAEELQDHLGVSYLKAKNYVADYDKDSDGVLSEEGKKLRKLTGYVVKLCQIT